MRTFTILLFLVSHFTAFCQMVEGDKLPVFELSDTNGEIHHSDEFVNQDKYLLIDFWASWCAPCRKANKKLPKLLAKNKNLSIVGISFDKEKKKMMNAITKDKLTHLNLIANEGFDSKVAALFGVEALPSSFLFDGTGSLVAINPTEKEIKSIIKSKNKS